MISIYSDLYLRKSSTIGYPMVGYWYTLIGGNDGLPNQFSEYKNVIFGNTEWPYIYNDGINTYRFIPKYEYINSLLKYSGINGTVEFSSLQKCKTYVESGVTKISISLPVNLVQRNFQLIALYYIDLLKFPTADITSISSESNFVRDIENLAMLLTNGKLSETGEILSGNISNGDILINASTNIIELPEIPKCSFKTSLNSGGNVDQIDHYQSSTLDRTRYFETMQNPKKLIESHSGMEKARSLQGTEDPSKLQGHFTISRSGLIKL